MNTAEVEQAEKLYADVRRIAPALSVRVTMEHDHYERWDGDGPAPDPDIYQPQNVTVAVSAIYTGRTHTGTAHLGGHYTEYGEPAGMVSGYLPQMIQDAAEELASYTELPADTAKQLEELDTFLTAYMRQEYDRQRAEYNATA